MRRGRVLSTGLVGVLGVLTAWAHTEPAGPGDDGRLWWELKRACADFYERCSTATPIPTQENK